jgi:hypothetical protein
VEGSIVEATADNQTDSAVTGEAHSHVPTHSLEDPASKLDTELPVDPTSDVGIRGVSEPPASIGAAPTTMPGQTTRAESFIERYAHMFADDAPSEELPPSTPPAQRAPNHDDVRKPRSLGVVSPAAENQQGEDEESIEQYMAKLLKRVRGDTSSGPTPQMSITSDWQSAPRGLRPAISPTDAASVPKPPGMVAPGPGSHSEQVEPARPASRPKVPLAEQSANLEAFRAVANESARRAIGTHALRVHRRNAVTKAIVATLAGMTSILLMLEAPDWRDLQFITACVSLLVAAYWAGQTYGTVIEAFRAAGYDGPESATDDLDSLLQATPSIDDD